MSTELFATEVPDLSIGYSTEDLLETHTGQDVAIFMFCLKLCLANIKCLSLFFNQSQKRCLLSATVFFHSESPSFILEQEWRYYRTSGDIRCDVGKGFIHNRELNMCYAIRTSEADFLDSSASCIAMNSHLVKIDSFARQQHLNKTIHFMSLNINAGEGSFKYYACWQRAGTDCQFAFASSSFTPDLCAGHCVQQGKKNAYLEKYYCYCCTKTTDPSQQVADTVCSYKCPADVTKSCGSLMDATGALYIYENPQDAVNFYIGLRKTSATWKWSIDETVAGFTAFDDTNSGTCAVMTSAYGFRWKSVDCSSKAGSICEITLN